MGKPLFMIDWVTATIPYKHKPLPKGMVVLSDSNGEVEQSYPRRLRFNGSYDASIAIDSKGGDGQGMATELVIDGNPSKFLQGHNVFGSDDLIALVKDVFLQIARFYSLPVSDIDLHRLNTGDYKINRIDINYSFELPSRKDVRSILRALEYRSKTRHGRPNMSKSTLYWGKSSRRWALKAYSKGDEIEGGKGHQLPPELQKTQISAWADNKLRIELMLRSLELKALEKTKANLLMKDTIYRLFREYIGRLEMSEQVRLKDKVFEELPTFVRSTYINWLNGEDCAQILSKSAFYRHRRELLGFGVDISRLRPPTRDDNNIIPIVRYLEAKPASIPDWAFEQGLIHPSANNIA